MNTEINNTETTEELQTEEVVEVKARRGRPPKVESAIFIEAWNKAVDLNSVAVALGMAPTSASVKASQMRKHGAALKRFRRGRRAKVKA